MPLLTSAVGSHICNQPFAWQPQISRVPIRGRMRSLPIAAAAMLAAGTFPTPGPASVGSVCNTCVNSHSCDAWGMRKSRMRSLPIAAAATLAAGTLPTPGPAARLV